MCPAAQRDTHRLPPGGRLPFQACLPSRVTTQSRASNREATFERREKQPAFIERLLKQRAGHLPDANLAVSSPGPVRWEFSNRMPPGRTRGSEG